MKSKIISFIIILMILLGFYVYFLSFIKIKNDEFCIVRDNNSKEIISLFYEKINFVWYGLFPGKYSIKKISKSNSILQTIKISIPSLKNLKGEYYLIHVPVKIIYEINPEKFSNINLLKDSMRELNSYIIKHFKSSFEISVDKYLNPDYLTNQILLNKQNILQNSYDLLINELKMFGIVLLKVEFSGSMIIPDYKIFLDGLKQLSELREIEKKNEKNLKAVINEINNRKLENEHFYDNLNQISAIIKKNPDILKYIYIDKLSSNVKVILPAEYSGIPQIFGDNYQQNRNSSSGEIDNLN